MLHEAAMNSKTLPALQDGGNDEEVQTPNWKAVARRELAMSIQQRGEEVNATFVKVADRLWDGEDLTEDDLETLRAKLRHQRTFIEQNVTSVVYTRTGAVQRLHALEWEMQQFFQLVSRDVSRGLDEEDIEAYLENLDTVRDDLEEILRDAQEGDA